MPNLADKRYLNLLVLTELFLSWGSAVNLKDHLGLKLLIQHTELRILEVLSVGNSLN